MVFESYGDSPHDIVVPLINDEVILLSSAVLGRCGSIPDSKIRQDQTDPSGL